MLELYAAGAVHAPEITRFKLADAAKAHEISEGRHLRGKLVLEVRVSPRTVQPAAFRAIHTLRHSRDARRSP